MHQVGHARTCAHAPDCTRHYAHSNSSASLKQHTHTHAHCSIAHTTMHTHCITGPGRLDWANQPNPFRWFAGAPSFQLPLPPSQTPTTAELSTYVHAITIIKKLRNCSCFWLFVPAALLFCAHSISVVRIGQIPNAPTIISTIQQLRGLMADPQLSLQRHSAPLP